MKNETWFADWFDTPFYHTLYKNRSLKEAEIFITNLLKHLNPPSNSKILDLACGKGRHAFYIAHGPYKVTGVDLSNQSIDWARKNYERKNLNFEVHDMRAIYKIAEFDFIFNIFTSFGYFEDYAENQKVVNSMAAGLKNEGILVIDFMNSTNVLNTLVKKETKEIDNIVFQIDRQLLHGFIVKNINFNFEGLDYHFQEKVNALRLNDFQLFFEKANLTLIETFGNYELESFDEEQSNRLIMILKKNA